MNFVDLKIIERLEGTPGVVDDLEIDVKLNANHIILLNPGEEGTENYTFARLVCGATICISMPFNDLCKKLKDIGANISVDEVTEEKPKKKTKKKTKKEE